MRCTPNILSVRLVATAARGVVLFYTAPLRFEIVFELWFDARVPQALRGTKWRRIPMENRLYHMTFRN